MCTIFMLQVRHGKFEDAYFEFPLNSKQKLSINELELAVSNL